LTNLVFIFKFRPKRFYKIGPRPHQDVDPAQVVVDGGQVQGRCPDLVHQIDVGAIVLGTIFGEFFDEIIGD
jgi:hypothetical protein